MADNNTLGGLQAKYQEMLDADSKKKQDEYEIEQNRKRMWEIGLDAEESLLAQTNSFSVEVAKLIKGNKWLRTKESYSMCDIEEGRNIIGSRAIYFSAQKKDRLYLNNGYSYCPFFVKVLWPDETVHIEPLFGCYIHFLQGYLTKNDNQAWKNGIFLCAKHDISKLGRQLFPESEKDLTHVEITGFNALRKAKKLMLGEMNSRITKLQTRLFGAQDYQIINHTYYVPGDGDRTDNFVIFKDGYYSSITGNAILDAHDEKWILNTIRSINGD